MPRHDDIISASEIGQWVYCHRAWLLARQGKANRNVKSLARGEKAHQRHSRQVASTSLLSRLSLILMIIAITLLVLTGAYILYVIF